MIGFILSDAPCDAYEMHASGDERSNTTYYKESALRWAMGFWEGVQSDGARRRSRRTIAAFSFDRMCSPLPGIPSVGCRKGWFDRI